MSKKEIKVDQDDGLLLPILYALLGGVGAFVVVLGIGIGVTAMQGGQAQAPDASQVQAQPQPQAQVQQQEPAEDSASVPVDSSENESGITMDTLGAIDAMDALLWQIESRLQGKFDGYEIENDDTSITVTVWRESIDNTVSYFQTEGVPFDADSWDWLKNNTLNAPDYICDCIRTSDFSGLELKFNVVDSASHETRYFEITNTEFTYDIFAGRSGQSGAEGASQVPEKGSTRTGQPSASSKPDGAAGSSSQGKGNSQTPASKAGEGAALSVSAGQTGPSTQSEQPAASKPSGSSAAQGDKNLISPAQGQEQAGTSQTEAKVPTSSGGRGNASNFYTYDIPEDTTDRWVLNTKSMKIHYPNCGDVSRIAPENRATSNLDESELLAQNYSVCQHCH